MKKLLAIAVIVVFIASSLSVAPAGVAKTGVYSLNRNIEPTTKELLVTTTTENISCRIKTMNNIWNRSCDHLLQCNNLGIESRDRDGNPGSGWDIIVPDDYPTIQEAINNANQGYRILVRAGVYYENVVIGVQSLTLHGEDRDITIIDAGGTGDVIKTTSDGVKISGFTMRSGSSAGIHLASHYNMVQENVIKENFYGMKLYSSTGNQIKNNTVVNNDGDGLWLSHSHENTIKDNNISGNGNRGIILNFSSLSNTIKFNNVSNNEIGIEINETSFGNSIYLNDFINNTLNAFAPSGDANLFDNGYKGNYWSDYVDVDENEDGIWDHPYAIPGGNGMDRYPLVDPVNHSPNKPSITGPTSGKIGTRYNYKAVTTDPNGDQIFYKWDWGEGTTSGWLGPYDSGELCETSHRWITQGSYEIRVKARDLYGAESDWAYLEVSIPRNKPLFFQFLECFVERFSLLERIMQLSVFDLFFGEKLL